MIVNTTTDRISHAKNIKIRGIFKEVTDCDELGHQV